MKREKKLLILLICVIVVSLAAWGATVLFAPEANIKLMDSGDTIFKLGDSKTLSWTYEDLDITFDISGDTWVYPEDETYTISKLYQSDILDQLTDLKSQKVITEPGNLADYGLAQPTCTITADEKTILIGDATGVGSHRYVSVGDGKVYLVSENVLYPFRHSLEKMIAVPSLPDLSSVTAVTVITEEETLELTCDENGTWFLTDGETQLPINTQVGESLSGYLSKLRFTACVDIDMKTPETYGMDAPCATYHIQYTTEEGEGSLTLILGDASNEGLYTKTEDSNRVYLINEAYGTFLGLLDKETLLRTEETEQS